jgi:nucleoside-diphosphate-sugar epimerase
MPENQPPIIVITGASGFLGSHLVDYFAQKGWHVRALVRSPEKYTDTKQVAYLKYDIGSPFDTSLLKGADYLVHAAYVKYDRLHPDALELNREGARALIETSRKNRLAKNVFISSMSAHEQAESVYGLQKLGIEKLFSTKKDVVLRSGLIIGNGGIVKQTADFMKSKHAVPVVGGGKQPLQIIAVGDLVRAIETALTTPVNGTYTVATSQVYTYKELYEAIAAYLKVKVLFVPVPFSVLLLMLQTIAFLRLPLNVSKDNALGLKKLMAVDNKADLAALKLKPLALAAALEESGLK